MSDISEFADAVRRVARGGSVLDPEVVSALLGRARTRSRIEELTPREREILALMAEGRSNQAISGHVYLSPRTVEAHVAHIFYKLGLLPTADEHRRVMAVVMSCAIIKRIPHGCLHSHDKRTISYSRIVRGHA